MDSNREHFGAIMFYDSRRGLTQQQCIAEFDSILALKLHQGPVFIDGIVSSIEALELSQSHLVKVVQNQLLLRKRCSAQTEIAGSSCDL